MIKGRIVIVGSGRDKGKPMIVVDHSEGYVFLADGKKRKLDKPKKKKLKHINPTNTVVSLMPTTGTVLQDADIRKLIGNFVKGGNRHCLKTM